MRRLAPIVALAFISLALTAWRYGSAIDADEAFAASLLERLAEQELLLVGVQRNPAFRLLELRRIGCASTITLGFAPDDGEADHALARLFPGGTRMEVASRNALRPGWVVFTDARPGTPCRQLAPLPASGSDPNG